MLTSPTQKLNTFGLKVRRGELISCNVSAAANLLADQIAALNLLTASFDKLYMPRLRCLNPEHEEIIDKFEESVPYFPPNYPKTDDKNGKDKPRNSEDCNEIQTKLEELTHDLAASNVRFMTANSAATFSLNRSFNRSSSNRNRSSSNRNRSSSNRNRSSSNRNRNDFDFAFSANSLGWREYRGLCQVGLDAATRYRGSIWANLDLRPPPGPDKSMRETKKLLKLQGKLKKSKQAVRREEIIAQAGFGLDDYTAPLGIDEAGGFDATRALLAIVLEMSNEIGMSYKNRFSRLRPNILQPLIRPFIAVPSHASYPSNHSFQSFAVAEMFARIYPEHPGCNALFLRAQRVAENREWAGLHYPSDTRAGRDLAKQTVAYIAEALDDLMYQAQQEWIN